jgi:drug/metabolite transporter (DMT)-like permease
MGNALGVVSGVFFALGVVFIRRDARGGQGDALPSMTLGNLIAAAATLPFVLRAGAHAVTWPGLLVLLYLGVVQLGVAYWLFGRGVRLVPAAEASLISMLEPVLNPVWVAIFWGERPGAWSIAGGAIVIAAVALRTVLQDPPGQRASTTSA